MTTRFVRTSCSRSRVSSQVKTSLLATAGHVYGFDRVEDAIKLLCRADECEQPESRDAREPRTTSSSTRRPSGGGSKGRVGCKKTCVTTETSQEVSDRDPGEVLDEAEDDARSEMDDPGASTIDLAQALTATAKKLKNVTLWRGWT